MGGRVRISGQSEWSGQSIPPHQPRARTLPYLQPEYRKMEECVDAIAALNATVLQLQHALASREGGSADPPPDCEVEVVEYNTALHVGAVFIILTASLLGVFSTLVGKHYAFCRLPPFLILLGKTTG